MAKVNYHIHTGAIKENLIPEKLTGKQTSLVYASEADLLNMALLAQQLQTGDLQIPMPKVICATRQH